MSRAGWRQRGMLDVPRGLPPVGSLGLEIHPTAQVGARRSHRSTRRGSSGAPPSPPAWLCSPGEAAGRLRDAAATPGWGAQPQNPPKPPWQG